MLSQVGARLCVGYAGIGGEGAVSPDGSCAGVEQKMYLGCLKHLPPNSSCSPDHWGQGQKESKKSI